MIVLGAAQQDCPVLDFGWYDEGIEMPAFRMGNPVSSMQLAYVCVPLRGMGVARDKGANMELNSRLKRATQQTMERWFKSRHLKLMVLLT